jgi:hypothetical protein
MAVEGWSIYHWLLAASFIAAPITFFILLFIDAPYGRFTRHGWGPTLNNRLGWCLMESPAVMVFGYLALTTAEQSLVLWSFFVMWQVHYLHRAFLYPFTLNSSQSMSIVVLLAGIAFNVLNGYLNGSSLQLNAHHYAMDNWYSHWQFQLGLTLFLIGTFINKRSDAELRRIRSDGGKDYQIPNEFLHKYVSCPNYLGEIIQWCGWAIATWSLAGLSFALWTIANLLPRALATHRWYQVKFPDYPGRKALIPGIL